MTMKITNKKELMDFDKDHRLKVLIVREADYSDIQGEIDYDFFMSISKSNGKIETETADKRKKTQRSYVCPICDQTCKGRKGLSSHMRQQHNTSLLDYEKEHGKIKSGAAIPIKKKTHDPKTYKCETCGATFDNRFSLGGHTASHKQTTKTCPKCGKQFKSQGFDIHVRYCKGKETKPEQPKRRGRPPKTEKKAVESPKQEVAKKIDGRSQQVICPLCKKEYGSNAGLSIHMKKEHGMTLREWQLQTAKRPERTGQVPEEQMKVSKLPPPENYVPPTPPPEPPIDPTTPDLKQAW